MALIAIRSLDRHFSSSSSANCNFKMNPGIQIPQGEMKTGTKLRLEYAQIYNTPFTIQTGVSDSIDFNDNSTNLLAVLTPGYYNGTTLATELGLRMTNASTTNTYTVTFVTQTRSLTIVATSTGTVSPFTILMSTGSHTAIAPWRELGFSSTTGLSPVNSTTGTTCTAPFPINLNLPLSWYVMIPELGQFGQTSACSKFSLYLPCYSASGQVMEYKSSMPNQVLITPQQWLRNLTVEWVNSSGSQLSLQNTEWEIIFSVVKE